MNNVILAKDINSCFSYQDGEEIKNLILGKIKKNEKVTVDFKNVFGINTSFINGCFVGLVKDVGIQSMRDYVSLKNVTKIASMTIRKMVSEVK